MTKSEERQGPFSLAVFFSSDPVTGRRQEKIARDLGKILAQNDVRLIFEGADRGALHVLLKSYRENCNKAPQRVHAGEPPHAERRIYKATPGVVSRGDQRYTLHERADAAISWPTCLTTVSQTLVFLESNLDSDSPKPCVILEEGSLAKGLLCMLRGLKKKSERKTFDRALTIADAYERTGLPFADRRSLKKRLL